MMSKADFLENLQWRQDKAKKINKKLKNALMTSVQDYVHFVFLSF